MVLLVLVMTLFAAREAVARSGRRYRGIRIDAWLVMAGSCLVVGGVVTQAVVGVRAVVRPAVRDSAVRDDPRQLADRDLALPRPLPRASRRPRSEVELHLAFGASRREALAVPLRSAVRTGMIPIVNAMTAAGIVSLPGMMTGQILAGSPPMQAVAYQIVVMFMIAAAAALGAMGAAIAAGRRLVAPDGTLRLDRLEGA